MRFVRSHIAIKALHCIHSLGSLIIVEAELECCKLTVLHISDITLFQACAFSSLKTGNAMYLKPISEMNSCTCGIKFFDI